MAVNQGLQTALKTKHIHSRFITNTKIKLEILKELTKFEKKAI